MGTEIWKTAIVNGEPWENYQVSNFGQILSLNYNKTGKPKLLKPGKNKQGYPTVILVKDGKKKTCRVHRLVAETFIPNPDNLPQVNHKIEGDEGKTMNFVFFNEDGTIDKERTTIEWVTAKENTNYGTRNERSAKTKSKPVLQFTLDGILVKEWSSTRDCGRNGFVQSNVSRCCRGEKKSHKGFIFKYK